MSEPGRAEKPRAHSEAVYDQRRPGLPVAYRCRSCGSVSVRGTFRAALAAFRQKARGFYLGGR